MGDGAHTGSGQEEKGDGSGKTALTFFRVFDLAFFAPGALLGLGALHVLWLRPRAIDLNALKETGTAAAVLLGVIGVLASFCIGAVVQTLARLSRITKGGRALAAMCRLIKEGDPATPPAVYLRSNAATRNDLVTYFWYLRSTFANLSLTALILGLLYGIEVAPTCGQRVGIVLVGVLCAVALAIGSGEYDFTLGQLPEQE